MCAVAHASSTSPVACHVSNKRRRCAGVVPRKYTPVPIISPLRGVPHHNSLARRPGPPARHRLASVPHLATPCNVLLPKTHFLKMRSIPYPILYVIFGRV